MKKLISLFLVLILLLSALSGLTVYGASLAEGTQAIYDTFREGKSALDYVYFSPVKDESDTKKYPLILWLHGNSSGDYPGHQLRNSDIHKFASDELQLRFIGTEGAFLLLPRDPTKTVTLAWDFAVEDAKKVLDDFVDEYGNNIDTNRIYVGGNSMGGKGVYKIAAAYPDVFAAIFPLSPVYIPTKAELKALSDTAVWIFSNTNDNYPQLSPNTVYSYFKQLNKYSSNPQNNRWTAFSAYHRPDGSMQQDEIHNTWTPVCNDLFMDDTSEYMAMSTVDGEGREINLFYPNGFISWLSSMHLSGGDAVGTPKGAFAKLIEFLSNIINAIISIFGI